MRDPRRRSVVYALLVSSICLLASTACVARFGDDLPRPVGIGRAADGSLRFVVTLCSGERLSSFSVADRRTLKPIWKVSKPTGAVEQGGEITVGDATGFKTLEIPLKSPIPPNVLATARLTDGFELQVSFLQDQVPRELAETSQVLDGMREKVSLEEFQRDVERRYC